MKLGPSRICSKGSMAVNPREESQGMPRNHDWQFFLELKMDKHMLLIVTQDEIVVKLDEKETTIETEKVQVQEVLLFANRNCKGQGKVKRTPKGELYGTGDKSKKYQSDRNC